MRVLGALLAMAVLAFSPAAQAFNDCEIKGKDGNFACGDQTIINELPPEKLRSLTDAIDRLEQLAEGEQQELQAQIDDLSGKLGFARNTVTSFFEILGETDVPTEDLQEKLTEIAEHYIELRDRADDLVSDDAAVQTLIDQARSAIGQGDYDEADELLIQAEEADIRSGEERFLNAAATRALRGETSLTRLRYIDAAGHFGKAAELAPSSVSTIKAQYFAQQGDALERGNRTLDAIKAYEWATKLDDDALWPWVKLGLLYLRNGNNLTASESSFISAQAAAESSKNKRGLAISSAYLGELKASQGNLKGALEALKAGQRALEELADEEPFNPLRQSDLSVSHTKIGDVLVAQGNLDGALESYQDSLGISERLADDAPDDAGWQFDLSISHDKIGNVLVAQGNLDGALRAYEDAHEIMERLAATDPGNTGWQRDLAASHSKIGNMHRDRDNLDGALRAYEDAHEIMERLAATDPGNAGWQRDLAVSHNKIGNVHRDQDNLDGALRAYQATHEIMERLAAADPGNADWQRSLSVSHEKIGDVRVDKGDLDGALQAYQDSLAIREHLAEDDPGNAGWQRDLIISNVKMSEVAVANDEPDVAQRHLQAALDIATDLAETGRLAPRDAWMPNDLQSRIDALIAPAAGTDG